MPPGDTLMLLNLVAVLTDWYSSLPKLSDRMEPFEE